MFSCVPFVLGHLGVLQDVGPMMNLPIKMSDTTLKDRLLLKTARGCEFLRGAIDNSIEGRKKPLFCMRGSRGGCRGNRVIVLFIKKVVDKVVMQKLFAIMHPDVFPVNSPSRLQCFMQG